MAAVQLYAMAAVLLYYLDVLQLRETGAVLNQMEPYRCVWLELDSCLR